MKKILTILLVAVLAASTLFAVDFSGKFRTGYTFKFEKGFPVSPWDGKENTEAKITMKISDDDKIWTVNIKDLGKGLDSDDKLKANLSLNVAKLLEVNGVDMGDLSLSLSIGANSKMTALSAYNDKTDDELFKLKTAGTYSTELAIGYGDIIKTKIQFDPSSPRSIMVSALTAPVKGLSFAAAYGYNAYIYTTNTVMSLTETDKKPQNEGSVKHGISVSADVNVGELADLDFKLGLAVYDNIGLGASYSSAPDNINTFAAILYGGVDVVDGFFELRMDNELVEKGATKLGMKTKVNINVVKDLGLDVYFNMTDFSKPEEFAVGGDVSYKISGVELAANLEYKAASDGGFSVTPKVIVEF